MNCKCPLTMLIHWVKNKQGSAIHSINLILKETSTGQEGIQYHQLVANNLEQ